MLGELSKNGQNLKSLPLFVLREFFLKVFFKCNQEGQVYCVGCIRKCKILSAGTSWCLVLRVELA